MNKEEDIDELVQNIKGQYKQKQLYKANIYNTILNRCKKKIKLAANNQQTNILFEIPRFSFNCPLYNLDECTFYIKEKLKRKFIIQHFTPNDLVKLHNSNVNLKQLTHILFISWEHIKNKYN